MDCPKLGRHFITGQSQNDLRAIFLMISLLLKAPTTTIIIIHKAVTLPFSSVRTILFWRESADYARQMALEIQVLAFKRDTQKVAGKYVDPKIKQLCGTNYIL